MSHLKKIFTGSASLLAMFCISTTGHAQLTGNVLVNGDFEDNVMSSYGNNTSVIQNGYPTGWSFVSGTYPNLVKVDGPGGQATWYTTGPDSDGLMAGAGVDRQYLDTLGSGKFYQTFTPKCDGEVKFGGAFSNRGQAASGSVAIHEGSGVDGNVIGQTNAVNISAGNPVGRPWVSVDYTTNLQAGTPYSFVITMNNDTNFDEAYVQYKRRCLVAVEADADMAVIDRPLIPVDPFPTVPDGEHFQCYMLQKSENIKPEQVTIKDQFGKSSVVLGRPVMICNPSLKIHKDQTFKIQDEDRHLVCYNYVKQDTVRRHELRVQTQFGKHEVTSSRRQMFCAPAGKNHVAEGRKRK